MEISITPLVKNKGGDLTDTNNYRAIAVSNCETKILETILLHKVTTCAAEEKYQFGFKSGHSTGLCTGVFKQTVNYYTTRGSHVFACFVDFTKAFDKVNYWKLFNQLLDDGISLSIVKLLSFWYSHQEAFVMWHNITSSHFAVSNGTKQGGILSPYLFTRYIRQLLYAVSSSHIGCSIGGLAVNILAYADDIVLLAPSWCALQEMLVILEQYCMLLDLTPNAKKTVCMKFDPKDRSKLVAKQFPCFVLCGHMLKFVSEFRYLGHIVTEQQKDDSDIRREIRNMYIRTNILIRRFSRCSTRVKLRLFTSYCMCVFGSALWSHFSTDCISKFRSCYHKCIKMFFGYKRMHSVTAMLFELSLPSFNTLLHNCRVIYLRQMSSSVNDVIVHLTQTCLSF
jgi:Reverse transcriptase (RNA-dependent DNA polymerase)